MITERKTRKTRQILRWVLWVLLIQFILINISAAFYAARLTKINPAAAAKPPTTRNIFQKTWRLFSGPRMYRTSIAEVPVFPYTNVSLVTESNIALKGWYGKTDSAAKGTVILFHGVTSNKSAIITEANEFRYMGYHVLLLDFRGHGESEGSVTSYGVREAEDVKLAYDFIRQQGETKIILWGISMGAVAVCRSISGYHLQPAAIILEAPFESLQHHLKGRARTLGFPAQPFGFLVTTWMGLERGFNGSKHKTTNYARSINCPALVQWGRKDTYVLQKEAASVYSALASGNKRLVVYDGTGHESMAQKETIKWRTEITSFLRQASY